eukprot:CAMPEP_0185724462 /NCGR_PEP_ID=MMETSP1171-20130828/936_1 /TAXON_ID=374046 /ORGANISM="Helicotheca tamensis, Strain CCMP826" /LENGTH=345 /DNA_ID=CAMNT_0028392315 /DNA_START=121 /DNA_END=1158 /DNA_ORIENTATION=-
MAGNQIRNSLGANRLRTLAKKAARLDETKNLDLVGISWLEHINLVVGTQPQAEAFYEDFLGFSRDPSAKFHVNLGQQQFHLAAAKEGETTPQRITGSIGLVVPDLDSVRERMEQSSKSLQGTLFEVLEDRMDEEGSLTISCPCGNTLHLYCAKRDNEALQPSASTPQKMVNLHAPGGSYSSNRMAVRGQPGIRFVEIACPVGSTPAIMKFYEEMLGCTVSQLSENEENGQTIAISVGPGIHLLYSESSTVTPEDSSAMEGVHICIYVPQFKSLYDKLDENKLIFTNPRFVHLDTCDTWEEAMASRTLRFKDIIDLDTGDKILELEHETRPMKHGQFMKVPFYVPK